MSLHEPLGAYRLTPAEATCPTCGHGAARLLYETDSAEVAQHFVVEEREPDRHRALRAYIEGLWGQATCEVLQCERCGFGYPRPYVAGDAGFYDLAYQRHDGAYPAWKWEYDQTLSTLQTLQAQGTLGAFRYLEIGAGDGAFVRAVAPALTAKDRVLCTEFSDYALDQLGAYGVAALREDVRALDPEAVGPFDVVATFQVLQHMVDLDPLFEQLGRLTVDSAHLFVAVPNARRIALHELNGAIMDLPPGHVGRWNRRAFEALGGRHGWTLRGYRTEPTSLVPFVREFAIYRHLRHGQIPGSPTNRVEAVHDRRLRKAFRVGAVGLHALASLPVVLGRGRHAPGHADWAWLQRGEA